MQTIYILRHFKVKASVENELNSKELKAWCGAPYLYM